MAAKGGVIAMAKQIALEEVPWNPLQYDLAGLVLTAQTKAFIRESGVVWPDAGKTDVGRVVSRRHAPLAVYLASDESHWVTRCGFRD